MKVTGRYLDNWFAEYRAYFHKAHAEWIDTHFAKCAPPKSVSFRSPLIPFVYEYKERREWVFRHWVTIKIPIYHYHYFYNDVPDILSPYEVNYSCTYDQINHFRMRSHTYTTRSKYLRR